MNKVIICKNCNKPYHTLKQCKHPITSYGIILFRFFEENIQYLMIRRKNTFGFIDFVKGEYPDNDYTYLDKLFNEMSVEERQTIADTDADDFEILWKKMWDDKIKNNLFNNSKKKFANLKKNGLIKMLVDNANTQWRETEWEFPKGRKNHTEKDIDCALREFNEETGISLSKIIVIDNILPFNETFIGTNNKKYKNKYFLSFINSKDESNNLDNFQLSEVSKIEWKNFEQCTDDIRPYNFEKKKLINDIHHIINEYQFI
jgi:ADP-ribose pyrophosphatase YjhB (NUDIX family)